MSELNTSGLKPEINKIIQPFLQDLVDAQTENTEAIYLTGSALTADYLPGKSDINTLVVVKDVTPAFLDSLTVLGKKYGKKGVAAPLIMTPHYIERSLDVFPIEFLALQSNHQLVYGSEQLNDLKISRSHLRLQCERELKGILVNLQQSYIRTATDREGFDLLLRQAVSSFIPVFRALVYLKEEKLPGDKPTVLRSIQAQFSLDLSAFSQFMSYRKTGTKMKLAEQKEIFNAIYGTLSQLIEVVDVLEV